MLKSTDRKSIRTPLWNVILKIFSKLVVNRMEIVGIRLF